jgi:hypothetical protein
VKRATGEDAMPGDKLIYEDFEPLVGTDFTLPGTEQIAPVHFTLVEATRLKFGAPNPEFREPFRLIFRSATQDICPQGLYQLTHSVLGETLLFLVPAARDEAGVDYCVTFN